jgi:hypothetical protein
MKNKILTLLLFLICSFQAGYSQNVFPIFADSARWNVYECYMNYTCETSTYEYEYDTSFCGNTYSKVHLSGYLTSGIGFVRSDSVRAYCRKNSNCSEKEYLMYDYSMNIGDSVYTGNNLMMFPVSTDTAKFVLISIDTVIYFGKERRVFHLLFSSDVGSPSRAMNWIEGIGSTTHPFYSMTCLDDGCEQSFRLLCYDSAGTQLYQDTVYNTCDTNYSIGIVGHTAQNIISILPNPFSNSIAITAENETIFQIDIYSIIGESVYSYKGINKQNFKIEFGNYLQKGIYLMKVQTDKGLLTKKIIKTE